MAVNDPFVMSSWGKQQEAQPAMEGTRMLGVRVGRLVNGLPTGHELGTNPGHVFPDAKLFVASQGCCRGFACFDVLPGSSQAIVVDSLRLNLLAGRGQGHDAC